MKKRLLALLLALCMVISMLPASLAADGETYTLTIKLVGGTYGAPPCVTIYTTNSIGSWSVGETVAQDIENGATCELTAGSYYKLLVWDEKGTNNTTNTPDELIGLYLLGENETPSANTAYSKDRNTFTEVVGWQDFTMPSKDVTLWAFFTETDGTTQREAPYILTESLSSGTVGTAYTASMSAIGDTSFTWSAVGLPDGLSIDAATGVISGAPTAAGTATVTVTATGKTTNAAGSKTFALNVAAPPDTTAPTLTAGEVSRTSDSAATVKFTSNEAGTYYYAFSSNDLTTVGTGTACAAGENTISLTGLTAGEKSFYFAVKDAAGNVSTALTITIPAYAPPVTETHSHPVCGAAHTSIGDHIGTCASITWTAWDGTDPDSAADGIQLTAGNYYLTGNITVNDAINVLGAVSLCLNGYSITLADTASNSVLIVGDDDYDTPDEFNLCDCNGSNGSHAITNPTDNNQLTITGGLITGGSGKPTTTSGSTSSYGGGVYTNTDAGFNMYGGTIAGNTAAYQGGGVYVSNNRYVENFHLYGGTISNNAAEGEGGGVYVHYSDFNMHGGTISGNTSGYDGGGVYVGSGSSFNMTGGAITGNAAAQRFYNDAGGGVYFDGRSFSLSGTPQITGNTSGTNQYGNTPRTDNVYLADETFITVNGAMTDGASVGISMETPGIFAAPDGTTVTDLTAYAACFSDDNTTDDYSINADSSGNLTLSQALPSTYPIYIGGIGLNDGEYLANGSTEPTTTLPNGGYAYYNEGVLTLSDFFYGGYDYSGVVYKGSLTVKLIGDSYLDFVGCGFDLTADDGSIGAIEFVNADTTYGYGVLDVSATMLVYYNDSVSPGSITVGENAYVYANAGIHATNLTVAGFLQSNDQIVLEGKLTRKGDGIVFADDYYYGAIEWVYGNSAPVDFDPADYLDLGSGEAVDEDGNALALGYYLYDDDNYYITFFDASLPQSAWTADTAAGDVELRPDPFADADIYIGGVGLNDGEYLANGSTEPTTIQPDGGYAYYNNGVLTLSDFAYEGDDYSGVEHKGSLTVKLIGSNELAFDLFDNEVCFFLHADGSSTPGIEFISGDSGGTLDVYAYELVYNSTYDHYGNITIGENVTVTVDAEFGADQLTVNGTLEVNEWTSLDGKLIRGANGTVRADFDEAYGVIEWLYGKEAPSGFNAADYLELTGGEAVDEDGNALVLGYYLYDDDDYYITFFDTSLPQSAWTEDTAARTVILRSKAAAPQTYAVTVTNGTGTGSYAQGASVTITANVPADGKRFKEWTGADGLTFTSGSATTAAATFIMPANAVNVTAVYEENETSVESQIVTNAITEVPEGLKDRFETPQQIVDALKRILIGHIGGTADGSNTQTYDVKLQFKINGNWIDATPDNFPQEGITVTLPYPEGTRPDTHNYFVTHMFTMDFNGKKAGETEEPPVTKTNDGIQVTLMGLSPVGVAWTEVAQDDPIIPAPLPVYIPQTHPVTVTPTDGGYVYTNTTYAYPGELVTFDVIPESGYRLAGLYVSNGYGTDYRVRSGYGSYYFTMPDGNVTITAYFERALAANTYSDVLGGTYYYDAVRWALGEGILRNTTGLFGPNVVCTRAEMVEYIWRAANCPSPRGTMQFTDVDPNASYAQAVQWAVEQGITTGTTAATFSPNDPVTRAQAMTFLWRYAGQPKLVGGSFSDVPADAYYAYAVKWAVQARITTGTTYTTFSPNEGCTRAQIITFLYRWFGIR